MLKFIIENATTLIVSGVLLVIIALIINKIIKDKKNGSRCGCNCERCNISSICHDK